MTLIKLLEGRPPNDSPNDVVRADRASINTNFTNLKNRVFAYGVSAFSDDDGTVDKVVPAVGVVETDVVLCTHQTFLATGVIRAIAGDGQITVNSTQAGDLAKAFAYLVLRPIA